MLTKALQTKFCRAIAHGQSMRAAAEAVGIGQSTAEEWHRRGRQAKSGKYRDFFEAVQAARVRLERDLDSVEWRIATDKSASPGARLRAVQAIRNRVFHQGRTHVHVSHSGHVQHGHEGHVDVEVKGEVEVVPARSLFTDEDLRVMSTEQLEAAVRALTDVTGAFA